MLVCVRGRVLFKSLHCQCDSLSISLPQGVCQSGRNYWLACLFDRRCGHFRASVVFMDTTHSWMIPMALDLTLIGAVATIIRVMKKPRGVLLQQPVFHSGLLWRAVQCIDTTRRSQGELPTVAYDLTIFPARPPTQKELRKSKINRREDTCASYCSNWIDIRRSAQNTHSWGKFTCHKKSSHWALGILNPTQWYEDIVKLQGSIQNSWAPQRLLYAIYNVPVSNII